jgi:hypothetical protein
VNGIGVHADYLTPSLAIYEPQSKAKNPDGVFSPLVRYAHHWRTHQHSPERVLVAGEMLACDSARNRRSFAHRRQHEEDERRPDGGSEEASREESGR